jgi:hypothetical protein
MAHSFAPSARGDVYTRITDEIVAAIEKGTGEWRMPWHHDGGSIARPRNVASDKPYRGINILALWVAATRSGDASGTWGTYRQWAERGFQVRRGETATTVVLWKLCGRPHNFQYVAPLDMWRSLRQCPCGAAAGASYATYPTARDCSPPTAAEDQSCTTNYSGGRLPSLAIARARMPRPASPS